MSAVSRRGWAWVAILLTPLSLLLWQVLDVQRYALPNEVPQRLVQGVPSPRRPTVPLLPYKKNNNPYLILHYGPAKTGTSTLQAEMTAWKDRVLQLDNLLYVGAYYHTNSSFAGRLPLHKQFMDPKLVCSRQMATVRREWEETRQTLSKGNKETLAEHLRRRVACIEPMLQQLEEYRANGTSLFFSNEVKSTVTAWDILPAGYSHAVSQDWQSLAALLAEQWNFVLVVGYRPFLDWVPSAKTQVDKFTPSKPRLANWPEKGGGRLRALFPPDTLVHPNETLWEVTDQQLEQYPRNTNPQILQNWRRYWDQNTHPFLHSHKIHTWSKEFVSIRFLHLYDKVPLRTNLLCHVLPITPRSCQASLAEDAKTTLSGWAHMNDGRTMMDRIWYDQLATAAVDQKLVPAHAISRAKLTQACRHHHHHHHHQKRQKVLQLSINDTSTTLLDLPHKCPHAQALLAFYDISWQMEKSMLGSAANRIQHAQLFRQNLVAGKYCNLDAARTLQQEEWRSFFESIATNKQA